MANQVDKAYSQFKWSFGAGIVSAAASVASGILNAQTAKTYGKMAQRQSEMQIRLNNLATERNIGYQTRQAADTISDIKRQGRQVIGSQLAAMAASGMSTASGSAQALLKSTGVSVGRDVSTVQANLINSAYEQRRQTAIENIGLRYQGQAAMAAAKQQANASYVEAGMGVLSAASSVAAKWQTYQDTLAGQQRLQTSGTSLANQNDNLLSSNKLNYGYGSEGFTSSLAEGMTSSTRQNMLQTSIFTPTSNYFSMLNRVSNTPVSGINYSFSNAAKIANTNVLNFANINARQKANRGYLFK